MSDYALTSYPGYEPGKPPRCDKIHAVSYLDELEKVWGNKWGYQGIGRLREVAMSRPTDDEINPFFEKDPNFFLLWYGMPDLEAWQKDHDNLRKLLEQQGVKVYDIKFPSPAIGPYGPMRKMSFCQEPMVVRGGAIIGRFGSTPYKRGQEPYFLKFLAEISCPVLYTIHGNGIWEPGPSVFIAEDVLVTHRGVAGNNEGIEQAMPVLQRAGVEQVHIADVPGYLDSIKWPAGGTYHTDMWLGPLDIGLAVIYPPWCGYETVKWLKEKGFHLIEISPEEQCRFLPANLIPIEPGKVIMPAGAEKTIKEVRKAGVEVIAFESQGIIGGSGGGMRCSVLYLRNERGPGLDKIKKYY